MSKFSLSGILRRKAIIISAILIVAIIVVAYVSISREKNRVFETFEVKSSVEIDGSIDTNYMKFAAGMIGYTTDGISYYAEGREIFNKAIQNYIADATKNIPNLLVYASALRVKIAVKELIGVWL